MSSFSTSDSSDYRMVSIRKSTWGFLKMCDTYWNNL
jgi:hypothetical protein